MSSRVREGGIGGVGLRMIERGMEDEVGFEGERSWGLGREGGRRRRCHLCLSRRAMSYVTEVIFFYVSLVRHP